MDRIRVLLVDDHTILRDGIKALLGVYDDNIEVVGEAGDGREAIELVRQLQPDVVIVDIAMPRLDGLEVIRRINKDGGQVKVLVLSQYDSSEYVLSAIKAGASGYLPKKALAFDLLSAIRAVHRGDTFLHSCGAKAVVSDYLRLSQLEQEQDPYHTLTNREKEVLKLVAEGYSNREVAELLVVSVKTVLGHRTRLMEKLDIHNRTDLIKYAIRKGLIRVG